MYLLQSDKVNYGIKLPTSLSEITNDILRELTKNIKLQPHYSVICLVYKTTLFNLASQIKGKPKDDYISVIPIIAKGAYAPDAADASVSTDLPVKESDTLIRPIIAPTSIERGYEVNIPTTAAFKHVMNYIQNDNDLRIELFQKKYVRNLQYQGRALISENLIEDNNTPIYTLGFKIVGNNDIVATVPITHTVDDYFIEEIGKR